MARKSWEALQKGVGGVGRPSQRDGMGRQALVEVWEWLGGPSGGSGSIGRPIWRDVRGREDLSKGLEGSVGSSEGSGQVGGPEEVGRCSRKDQLWSAISPGEPGGIGRPSRRAGTGQEAILEGWYGREGQEGSVGPPVVPCGVGKPSRKARRHRETRPKVSEGSGVPSWWARRGLEALLMGR